MSSAASTQQCPDAISQQYNKIFGLLQKAGNFHGYCGDQKLVDKSDKFINIPLNIYNNNNNNTQSKAKETCKSKQDKEVPKGDVSKNIFFKRTLKIKKQISPKQIFEKKMSNINLKIYSSNLGNQYIPVLPSYLVELNKNNQSSQFNHQNSSSYQEYQIQ